MSWPEGMIKLDSPIGVELGFTSDVFSGYLWKRKDQIIISFIESVQEGKGHLSRLFSSIWSAGYCVAVPTPMARMEAIVRQKEFEQTFVYSKDFDEHVEVWVKEPPTD